MKIGAVSQRLSAIYQSKGMRGQLLRGGIGSLLLKTAAAGLSLAVAVVLARSLGPEGYGIYSYVFALVSLISIPAQFGLPHLVVRETASFEAAGKWGLIRGIWYWANIVTGVFSVTLALVAGCLVWIFADRLTSTELITMSWGAVLIPLIALGNLRGAALRGLRRVVIGQLPEAILRPALLVVLVLSVVMVNPVGPFTAAQAMLVHVSAAAIAFLLGAWMLLRARPDPIAKRPRLEFSSRAWAGATVPLAFVSGMQVVNQHASILMLGIFASAADVGIYKVVSVGGTLVVFGLRAVNMVVAPYFARLYAQKDKIRLQRVVVFSARVSLLVAVPTAVVFIVWGSAILDFFFGAEFAAGHVALAILAVGQVINAGIGSVGFLLNMTGHEKDAARGVFIAAVCNVFLNLALIPTFGITGAAVATVLTLALWNVLLCHDVWRRLGITSGAWGIVGGMARTKMTTD